MITESQGPERSMLTVTWSLNRIRVKIRKKGFITKWITHFMYWAQKTVIFVSVDCDNHVCCFGQFCDAKFVTLFCKFIFIEKVVPFIENYLLDLLFLGWAHVFFSFFLCNLLATLHVLLLLGFIRSICSLKPSICFIGSLCFVVLFSLFAFPP